MMRLARLTVLTAALGLAGGAHADTGVIRTASAIVMIEIALAREDAATMIGGLEMLLSLAPGGDAAQLASRYMAEARFYARGEPTLMARLDALVPSDPVEAGLLVLEFNNAMEVPDGTAVSKVSLIPETGGSIMSAQDIVACSTPGPEPVRTCDPTLAKGALRLDLEGPDTRRIAVMRVEPVR